MIEYAILLLIGAVLAVPLFSRLGLGAVLGYICVGIVLGPWGFGTVDAVEDVFHFGELGVVLLLFVIGLELRVSRLLALRKTIFGFGAAQVVATAVVLSPLMLYAGEPVRVAVLVGFALALSSTAFALQLLRERNELTTRHGRSAFGTLLFQDLAVVPLLAVVPVLAGVSQASVDEAAGLLRTGVVLVVVVVVGRYLLRYLLRLVAASGVQEALTAAALLIVLGTAYLVQLAGLSMALGAFMAGVLLADSEYRHQLEAEIEPFKGLLLGLFFIAVGMTLNLGVLATKPGPVLVGVALLVGCKFSVLYLLGRLSGLDTAAARRLGLLLSQGGEFAFVVFGSAAVHGVLDQRTTDALGLVVSLSMVLTPVLLLADRLLSRDAPLMEPDPLPVDQTPPVVIAGFGRFGQIVARVLRARHIPFVALDASADQVDFVRRYGNEIYYGDARRPDLLRAAGVAKAKVFVLAVDEVAASLQIAALVRREFPHIKVFARARNRKHAHQLMDLGVEVIRREMFLSALGLTYEVLIGLGVPADAARSTVDRFRKHDERRLYRDWKHHTDEQKMRELALTGAQELEEMFEEDRKIPISPQRSGR
ncbi:MAG: monovalent cation:proton antiporter-2 (CPA2) family protein [Pseudomonadota bacterium]|nr:monovalent cation:proton antiporter-2 (CPA2) family protein [Pseudomonadota bacterium]